MTRRLPPLNAVRAFEAAGRHLSFSRAATELAVTPAAVSQQIKALEDSLGETLFRRGGRQLVLTEAGQLLLPGTSAGFDALDEAFARLRRARHAGALHINTSPAFASKWLIGRLDRFQRLHPDIAVRFAASMALVDFDRDDVDVAIRYGRGGYAGLESEFLTGETAFPVCSPALLRGAHPLKTLDDLRHHQLLHEGTEMLNDVTPSWAMWLKAAGQHDIDPDAGLTLNPWMMVLEAALLGQGVALGRASLVQRDLEAGHLVRPFELSLPVEFAHWLVYRPGALAQPKIRAFRDWISAEAEAYRAEYPDTIAPPAAG